MKSGIVKSAGVAFLVTAIMCCQPAKESRVKTEVDDALTDALTGEWRNTYLKVTMNSVNNIPDSVYVLEADSSNWVAVVKLKPIRTFFEADGTYHSDHYSPGDSLVFSARGTWGLSNDTLVMKQTSPNRAVYRMKTILEKNTVTFSGILDFDEDGHEDDQYFGRQKKIPAGQP